MNILTKQKNKKISIYFSDYFNIPEELLERHGAFNISLINDLPLFIDPFLIFNSPKQEYQILHEKIISYVKFLKEKAGSSLEQGLIKELYSFPEVKQNWLGFTFNGNRGSGPGANFANSLNNNLTKHFKDFGNETITKGSHIEKLCLVKEGIGKDFISDFTTNLIKEFLLEYTQDFAKKYLKENQKKEFTLNKVSFNYKTERWISKTYTLPFYREENDCLLLTPKDMLTREDTWINRSDLIKDFSVIADAISNDSLRASINNYFAKLLPDEPKKKDEQHAAARTILQFPEMFDFYIKYKEEQGDRAVSLSKEKVKKSEALFVLLIKELVELLNSKTEFYQLKGNTYDEALLRANYLKDLMENKGGYKIFYTGGQRSRLIEFTEGFTHILYRLTWYGTVSDINREVDNGSGGVDFAASNGKFDKSLIEFKLAKSTSLRRNLEKQLKVYEKANDTNKSITVIFFFSEKEHKKVLKILQDLNLIDSANIILIDARQDNKPSGSKA